ncbi:MAG: hypothetical protein N0E58_09860 [Candidatus Thiodiazotropha endolucinida]|uniref:ABC-three component systems C-terminal domain-containing protein n=1 Tax=Candidatus Thiodiazotropha taylori TaxID=2792791 RepID=A0A9E4NJI9_9GAMM|nr:hypothetical protein [Candidatus Thiodiazotropha taylori]MCW4236552.1 hypothetical protein [Candidatus Thiodiazotropha endolucinida]
MNNHDDFWYRTLFKVRLYEAFGTSFQHLINQLFQYSVVDFQSIQPWGNWGDGGNDGWVEPLGSYYQVYGPIPTSKSSPVDAVKKAVDDFKKLPEKWENVNNYYFVYNDRYAGVPAPLAAELQQLKKNHRLSEAKAIVGADLESKFMELDLDTRQIIIGGVPSCEISHVDPRSVGELLSHLADSVDPPVSFLSELAPDFLEKIKFNGLSQSVSDQLRTYSYQTSTIDEFLDRRDIGLSQSISKEISSLYEESKAVIPDTQENAPNVRYVWMVEKLIPETMKNHPHSMKAYREAAQVILSKYFETCDAYEHPNSPPAA